MLRISSPDLAVIHLEPQRAHIGWLPLVPLLQLQGRFYRAGVASSLFVSFERRLPKRRAFFSIHILLTPSNFISQCSFLFEDRGPFILSLRGFVGTLPDVHERFLSNQEKFRTWFSVSLESN